MTAPEQTFGAVGEHTRRLPDQEVSAEDTAVLVGHPGLPAFSAAATEAQVGEPRPEPVAGGAPLGRRAAMRRERARQLAEAGYGGAPQDFLGQADDGPGYGAPEADEGSRYGQDPAQGSPYEPRSGDQGTPPYGQDRGDQGQPYGQAVDVPAQAFGQGRGDQGRPYEQQAARYGQDPAGPPYEGQGEPYEQQPGQGQPYEQGQAYEQQPGEQAAPYGQGQQYPPAREDQVQAYRQPAEGQAQPYEPRPAEQAAPFGQGQDVAGRPYGQTSGDQAPAYGQTSAEQGPAYGQTPGNEGPAYGQGQPYGQTPAEQGQGQVDQGQAFGQGRAEQGPPYEQRPVEQGAPFGQTPDQTYEPQVGDPATSPRLVGEPQPAEAPAATPSAARQALSAADDIQRQVTDQVSVQQQRAAAGVRDLARGLADMAAGRPATGLAPELAQQAADRLHGVADHLERRSSGELVDDVRRLARKRPGAFLAGTAVAGFALGRLVKGGTDQPAATAEAQPAEAPAAETRAPEAPAAQAPAAEPEPEPEPSAEPPAEQQDPRLAFRNQAYASGTYRGGTGDDEQYFGATNDPAEPYPVGLDAPGQVGEGEQQPQEPPAAEEPTRQVRDDADPAYGYPRRYTEPGYDEQTYRGYGGPEYPSAGYEQGRQQEFGGYPYQDQETYRVDPPPSR